MTPLAPFDEEAWYAAHLQANPGDPCEALLFALRLGLRAWRAGALPFDAPPGYLWVLAPQPGRPEPMVGLAAWHVVPSADRAEFLNRMNRMAGQPSALPVVVVQGQRRDLVLCPCPMYRPKPKPQPQDQTAWFVELVRSAYVLWHFREEPPAGTLWLCTAEAELPAGFPAGLRTTIRPEPAAAIPAWCRTAAERLPAVLMPVFTMHRAPPICADGVIDVPRPGCEALASSLRRASA